MALLIWHQRKYRSPPKRCRSLSLCQQAAHGRVRSNSSFAEAVGRSMPQPRTAERRTRAHLALGHPGSPPAVGKQARASWPSANRRHLRETSQVSRCRLQLADLRPSVSRRHLRETPATRAPESLRALTSAWHPRPAGAIFGSGERVLGTSSGMRRAEGARVPL